MTPEKKRHNFLLPAALAFCLLSCLLGNALDSHWNYLTAAIHMLEGRECDTEEEMLSIIDELERLLETDRYSSRVMLLDSQGNCYDTDGEHGVWSDLDRIAGGEERYTFISDSLFQQGSYCDHPCRPFEGRADAERILRQRGLREAK